MKLSPGRSPGRLSALLAERDAARAERDAANIALAMQIQKDLELEKRLEALESMQQPERMAASQMRLSLPRLPHAHGDKAFEPSAALLGADSHERLDVLNDDSMLEVEAAKENGSKPEDAAWLCAASCVSFAEAITLAVQSCGSFSAACVLICRACCAVGATLRRGTAATLRMLDSIANTCMLPPPPTVLPPPRGDEPDDPIDINAGVSSRTQILLGSLAAVALFLFVWLLVFCGFNLAAWVPIGALAGLLGSCAGIGVAALATPVVPEDTPEGGDEAAAGDDDVSKDVVSETTWTSISAAAWPVGAASAFSAAFSGLVSWSTNEVVHVNNEWISDEGRSRMLLLTNLVLLLGFGVRNGYKTWRGGGYSRSRRLLLVARDGGCGCGWPALL